MKPFLVISKYQEELILAVILACSIIGILLLFGLGLSDTTYQGMSSDHIIGQQPKCPKSTRLPCNAERSEVRHNRHAIKTCQEGENSHE